MRRLTTLTVTGRDGFKGWTGTVKLHGCDVFAGPNGTGKSTRLEAIVGGLRGLSRKAGPGPGVYVGPTSARPRSAKVRLDWNDGQSLARDLSVVQGKKATEANIQADMLVGPHVTRWDLGDFASSTDKARAELLKGLVGAGSEEWDGARVWRFLDERMDVKAKSRGADYPLVRLQTDHGMPDDGELGPWLDSATDWAGTQFTAANSDKRQAGQAVKELQQQAREQAEAQEGGNLAQVRQRAGEVAEDLRQLAGQIATASQAGQAVKAYQEQSQRLARAMGKAGENLERAEGRARKAGERLQQAQERLEGLQSLDEAKSKLGAAEKATASAKEQAAASKAKLDTALQGYQTQRDTVGRAEEAVATLQALLDDVGGGVCRACGDEDPVGLRDRIDAAQARVDEEAAKLPKLQLRGRMTRKACERDEQAEHDASERLRVLERHIAPLETQHQTARSSLVRAEEMRDLAQSELTRCQKAAEEAELDLQAFQQEDPPQGAAGDLDTLQARQTALQQEQKELRKQGESLARNEGGEQALQQALARRDSAEKRWRAVKDLQAALAELQAEVARGAYGPILDHANRLLADADVPLRAYIEDEGDFGAEVRDKRVHFASLSDGERALVAASFAYAFAAASGSPCPMVILDRLEAIDEDRVAGFLRACRAAVEDGRIANFVGALRCKAEPDLGDAYTHWLGE